MAQIPPCWYKSPHKVLVHAIEATESGLQSSEPLSQAVFFGDRFT
jgi:hypothetical protein